MPFLCIRIRYKFTMCTWSSPKKVCCWQQSNKTINTVHFNQLTFHLCTFGNLIEVPLIKHRKSIQFLWNMYKDRIQNNWLVAFCIGDCCHFFLSGKALFQWFRIQPFFYKNVNCTCRTQFYLICINFLLRSSMHTQIKRNIVIIGFAHR